MSNLDNIKVPSNIKDYTRNAMREGKKIKLKGKCKKLTIASISVLTIFSGVVGASLKYPSFAEKIPFLNDMMYLIQRAMQNGSMENGVTVVDKSFSNDGLTFTANKAWFGGNQVYIDFTIKSDKPFKETEYAKALSDTSKIDNNPIPYLLVNEWKLYIDDNEIRNLSFEQPRANFVDDYTIKSNFLIDFVPEDFEFGYKPNIKFEFQLGDFEDSIADTTWKMDFDVKSDNKIFKKLKVNESKDGIMLRDIKMNQTSLNINLKSNKENPIGYVQVKDDKGNILNNGISICDDNNYEAIAYLNEIGVNPRFITITVYGDYNKDKTPISEFKVDL